MQCPVSGGRRGEFPQRDALRRPPVGIQMNHNFEMEGGEGSITTTHIRHRRRCRFVHRHICKTEAHRVDHQRGGMPCQRQPPRAPKS